MERKFECHSCKKSFEKLQMIIRFSSGRQTCRGCATKMDLDVQRMLDEDPPEPPGVWLHNQTEEP